MKSLLGSGMGCLASLLALANTASAFYIPGWSIKSYKDGEHIPLMVNKVYSDNTQLQYAYFDLPFVCPPTGRRTAAGLLSGQSITLNLGEVLRGDRIRTSDVALAMGSDTRCASLCRAEVSRADVRRARDMVRDGYVVEWIVDNLPGATSFVTVDKSRKYYAAGFKLGFTDFDSLGRPRYFLNNHHTIVIRWRRAPGKAGDRGAKVIVGFEVYPKSVGPANRRGEDGCPLALDDIDSNFELYMAPNKTAGAKSGSLSARPTAAGSESADLLDGAEDDGSRLSIPYTYSVYFREENGIDWNRRWDLYFVNQEEGSKIHWLAIVNSLIICGLLTGIVTMILAKTIRSDIKAGGGYRELMSEGKGRRRRNGAGSGSRTPGIVSGEKALGLLEQETDLEGVGVAADDGLSEDEDETALEDVAGWKLLHADVFRAPARGHLLAPLVGSGTQLLFMAVGLVLLSALGVLNPSFRGGFISFGVGLFVFAGLFSGYFSARVHATIATQQSSSLGGYAKAGANALVTATLVPGLLFGAVFVMNLFVWAQASSTAIPFGTLLAILVLWLCVQVPLVYAGAWLGAAPRTLTLPSSLVGGSGAGSVVAVAAGYVTSALSGGAWEHPTRTGTGPPRAVPRQAWYVRPAQSALLAGLIPFAVVFIELLFVFQSVWQDKSGYYYVFGFLAVVSVILLVTVAEVTVVTVYIRLCAEDHAWWWQSFLVGGSSAVWVFAYCVWYYFFKLHISGFASSVLFFSYSFMACCVYGLLTGTVGFLSAFAFVRRIYGAIKVD